MTPKKYDIVIYGATGFIGRQVVAYCSKNAPGGVKWAIAGRNLEKLQGVKCTYGENEPDIDILVADCRDEQAVDLIVQQSRIMIATVGPFALYGENLIASCCKHGTDYVDITGETYFVSRMIEKYEELAKGTGAKIIPFCGFDAVPSDLGALIAVRYINRAFESATRSAKGFFSIKGGFNGGTLATMLNMFESGAWTRMKDPGILLPHQARGVSLVKDADSFRYDQDVNSWTSLFMMAPINTRIVNRSAALSASWGESYGENFLYRECHKIGKWWNPFPAMLITLALKAADRLGQSASVRKFIRLLGPRPGEGPSARAITGGFFRLEVIATDENENRVRVQFSGAGDPGNQATVKFLCEAAFCLATRRSELPGGDDRCGFLTPATGLGSILIDRLKEAGIKINCETI